jgi:hypothetical protein
VWKVVASDAEQGLIREERCLLPGGRASAGHLLRQVRYRHPLTRAVVRVEPDRRLARRRVSSRSAR